MIAVVATLFVLGLLYMIAAISQFPGIDILADELSPLAFGYNSIYGIDMRWTTLIVIPITYFSVFGNMFAYGRQICAMAESGLFHKSLTYVTKREQTPYVAIIFGSAIVLVVMAFIQFLTYLPLTDAFNLVLLFAFSVYGSSLCSFIIFRYKFAGLERKFTSPLGVYGAWYGIFVFSIGFISIVGFQATFIPLFIFVGLIFLMSLNYYFFSRHSQFFSTDEQNIMMVAYVINGKYSEFMLP